MFSHSYACCHRRQRHRGRREYIWSMLYPPKPKVCHVAKLLVGLRFTEKMEHKFIACSVIRYTAQRGY